MRRRQEYDSPLGYLVTGTLMAIIAVMLVVSLYGMTQAFNRLQLAQGDCQAVAEHCDEEAADE